MTDVNSNAYWDARYAGDWQACDGPGQSRFLSNMALRALPKWVFSEIRRSHMTVADWGCGEGDGTDVWAAYAPVEQITGVDFSTVAIGTAKCRYPKIQFLAENWLNEGIDTLQFDVVYSSNVMEHFHDPQAVLEMLCTRAKQAIILALPYRETSRVSEHFFTFTPNNIPIAPDNRFRLVFSKVIDCSKMPESRWLGEQIVLVYVDAEWSNKLKLTLNDSSIESDSNDAEIASLRSVVAELKEKSSGKEERQQEEVRSVLSNLGDLHRQHVVSAREHTEWIERLSSRERESTERYVARILAAQSELSRTQTELRSIEQKWSSKLQTQNVLFAAKHDALQEKLIHSQQKYASLANEKIVQAETLEKKIAELRNLAERQQLEQTQTHMRELELLQLSAQQDRVEQSESIARQTQAHANEIELIQLSAERHRVEQSESFAKELLDLQDTYTKRERELTEKFISVQDESTKANKERQSLLDQQVEEHEQQASRLRIKIEELERANWQHQAEAREKQEKLEERLARESELRGAIAQRDKSLHAMASYVALLEQWRYAVEASLLFRLLSCFSSRMRQSIPRQHPLEVALIPSGNGRLEPRDEDVKQLDINNYLSMRNSEEMKAQYMITVPKQIENADDLLMLQGVQFIDAAYRLILDRDPDELGKSYYFKRLQMGVSKVEILSQISESEEAKSMGRVIPRLGETIFRTKWSRVPLLGWLAPRGERTHYKVRAIEHSLSEIRHATTQYMPRLEREIAERGRHIENSTGAIAELRQQLAAKEAELAGKDQMLAEVTERFDQLARTTDLSWEQFQTQILARRNEYKGIFIQELVIDWNVPLYQRPQHIATAFGRLGYLVIFRTDNWAGDNVHGFRQVEKNVWITNRMEASSIDNAVYSFYSTAYANTPERIQAAAQRGVVVYEYIDHIDPMISGTAENVRRLVALKDYAFSGGAHFVVASANKLQQEAVEEVGVDRVILAQNGVDTAHYRNRVHEATVLPDSFVQFRRKYKKVVGYFGALAPWLWYDAINELTAARPDLGFVFIGPDYYGGSKKLAVRENVLYLGAIDYKILPAYARQFDVCFIPFSPGEIAKTTSPLKLFEYFALEKPVVATADMAECVAFPEVFSGDSATGLAVAIDSAFQVKDDKAFKVRLSQLADENAWIERARAMEAAFNTLGVNQ